MKPCPLCKTKMQLSTKNPLVRCQNTSCTAYNIKLKLEQFEEQEILQSFVEFWEVFPKKTNKLDALRAWIKLNPSKDMFVNIIASIVSHKFEAVQWQNKQYIPYPGSFIRGRMWENDIIKEEPEKIALQFNQPVGGKYITKEKVKSTPKSKAMVKEMIDLGKILFASKTKEEKARVKKLMQELQSKIEIELGA